jgi:hypothetical protein
MLIDPAGAPIMVTVPPAPNGIRSVFVTTRFSNWPSAASAARKMTATIANDLESGAIKSLWVAAYPSSTPQKSDGAALICNRKSGAALAYLTNNAAPVAQIAGIRVYESTKRDTPRRRSSCDETERRENGKPQIDISSC